MKKADYRAIFLEEIEEKEEIKVEEPKKEEKKVIKAKVKKEEE